MNFRFNMKRLTRYISHCERRNCRDQPSCLDTYVISLNQLKLTCSKKFITRFLSLSVPTTTTALNHSRSSSSFGCIPTLNASHHRRSQGQLVLRPTMTQQNRKFYSENNPLRTEIAKMPASSSPTSQKEEETSSRGPVNGYQRIDPNLVGPVPDIVVDLRSDTVTLPSKGMRQAIANAIVGDDVFDEDPTTKEFERRVAELLQKEDALLVTSGTQGNLISSLVHCNVRGSELICGNNSHVFKYEQANVAQFGGIHSVQITNNPDGTFSLEELEHLFRSDDIHYPITKLVCVENTHNRCGGRILPLEWLDQLAVLCNKYSLPIHMDGARVFNAAVGSGVPVSRIVRDMSSVSICLSKGLGAPAGSVIAGSKSFIAQARRMRKALGGGLRQNGILSASGLYCLDFMIDRLEEDHQNAKLIAEIINSKGDQRVWIDTEMLQTNILVLNVKDCPVTKFIQKLVEVDSNEKEEREYCEGQTTSVKCFPWSLTSARLVTHVDVTREMARRAALKICYVARKLKE